LSEEQRTKIIAVVRGVPLHVRQHATPLENRPCVFDARLEQPQDPEVTELAAIIQGEGLIVADDMQQDDAW
jgi:hypothetical protein